MNAECSDECGAQQRMRDDELDMDRRTASTGNGERRSNKSERIRLLQIC